MPLPRIAPLIVLLVGSACLAEDGPSYDRDVDVVYGRKHGTALTMDVFTPKQGRNGAAVLFVVSGGWFSSHESISPPFYEELLKRGYTVFAVVHGSQPKFTIPEIIPDIDRAVRFIRHHAADYGIDPERIGISGASAGGHLSLMQGTAGTPGKADATDPVERASSRVQAVACFFPPTDFLNYGKPKSDAIGRGTLDAFAAPFDFQEFDKQKRVFVPIEDEDRRKEIGREISPINHVSADDPPTLILHGDADHLVPLQQAESFLESLKGTGVETKLVVKPGASHGWPNLLADMAIIADWFDAHLGEPIPKPNP